MEKTYEQLQQWDFTVNNELYNYGIMKEEFMKHTLTGSSFEIKSDRVWQTSGNIYIEIYQEKKSGWKPSGLSVTKSDFYGYILDDNSFGGIPLLLPTKWLKNRLKMLYNDGYIKLITKFANPNEPATKGLLVPLKYLFITDEETDYNKKKKIKEYVARIN